MGFHGDPVWTYVVGWHCALVKKSGFTSKASGCKRKPVRVEENQTVIETGLYGIVRHPMYLVTLLLFLSMSLVLGCLWSFFLFLFYPIILVKRIKNEEQVLKMELPGYVDYCKKVRYRLIPGIW